MTQHSNAQRLEELLAGQVLGDLSPEETKELEQLKLGNGGVYDDIILELEQTLGRVQLAMGSAHETLPASLRARIADDAMRHLGSQDSACRAVQQAREIVSPEIEPASKKSFSLRETAAWLTCAAALLLAFGLWQSNQTSTSSITTAAARANLIAESDNLVRVEWGPGKHPFDNTVTGDVVWDNDKQQGFMRFEGMPVNDSSTSQYQLWIIDPKRDDEPIDGGVFDIASKDEVIVPINAKLKVLEPAAFAITVEKPGGVVVSTQDNLPLLAAIE